MNGIAFASPWVLAAAAAVAIPVLAHLVRHEDRQGRGFPSLMFLRRVPFPARARRRLADRALLALRVLAIVSLVLAFAGPHPRVDPMAAAPGTRDTVVLLDVSFSMGSGGGFANARALASEVLREAGSGERVAVVLFDDDARLASPLDAGPAVARAAIEGAVPGHRGTDYPAALRRAARVLANSSAATRRVVLVSDLQETGLSSGAALPRPIELELRAVPVVAAGNLSVAGAVVDPADGPADDPADDNGRRSLRVLLRNTSAAPATSSLTVRVSGLDAAREELALQPGELREVVIPVFPAADAQTRVAVFLDDDALAADNRHHLTLAPPRTITVVLISDGRGAPYLSAALAPARNPLVRVRRIAPDGLERASLDGVDLLILDAPPGAATFIREAIDERAAAGMGILAFASAAGGVPGSAPRLGGPPSRVAGTSLVPTSHAHPLAPVLGEGVVSVGPVWRHAVLEALASDTVLATFEDGSPAIVARARAAARSLSVATALGDDWSALGQRPEFAPWLLRSAAWLAGVVPFDSGHAPGSVLDVAAFAAAAPGGAAFTEALTRGEPLTVRRPSGRLERLAADRPLVLEEPGFHELRAGSVGPLWVAVSVASVESDLARLTEPQFLARIQRPAGIGDRRAGAAAAPPPDPQWGRLLAFLGALLLLLEGLTAGWLVRRSAREVTA